jgi:hypothetical protein
MNNGKAKDFFLNSGKTKAFPVIRQIRQIPSDPVLFLFQPYSARPTMEQQGGPTP